MNGFETILWTAGGFLVGVVVGAIYGVLTRGGDE